MSPSMSAVSANSMASKKSTESSRASSKAPKVGQLEQRAIEGHAKKLALLEGYKKLLRVIKMAEKYYEKPLQNGMNKKYRFEKRNYINDFLGSKKIYTHLPNINENMTNEQINAIINKQKTKMKQGVLRGKFTNFRVKTDELVRMKKQKASTTKQEKHRALLRKMRNELLTKHSNLDHFKDAEQTITQFLKQVVIPLKESFKRYEEKTQNMILTQQEMNKARDEKQKKKEELQKYKKLVKLFKAKQKKIVKAKVKAIKRSKEKKAKQAKINARKEDKEIEMTARQEAKEADTERKQAIINEKAAEKARKEAEKEARRVEREEKAAAKAVQNAEKKVRKAAREEKAANRRAEKELRKAQREAKEAIKQAAILTAGMQMSGKNFK
jgi:hypothetical protein